MAREARVWEEIGRRKAQEGPEDGERGGGEDVGVREKVVAAGDVVATEREGGEERKRDPGDGIDGGENEEEEQGVKDPIEEEVEIKGKAKDVGVLGKIRETTRRSTAGAPSTRIRAAGASGGRTGDIGGATRERGRWVPKKESRKCFLERVSG